MISKKIDIPFWTQDTFIKKLIEIFGIDNIKLVGGAVRNAIRKNITNDLDLAVNINPNEVKALLNKNNIKFHDISKGHGTVSLKSKFYRIEITSLRKDIKTYGRKAKVEFTKSFQLDSERRDFTVNAIYSSLNGDIFDPHKGYEDLHKNIIKFIGIPEKRILEDRLRLLRYFRMVSYYSSNYQQLHINSLNASVKEFYHIQALSKERINIEFFKLIVSKYAAFSLNLLKSYNLLDFLVKGLQQISTKNLNKLSQLPKEKLLRMSFLIITSKVNICDLQRQLKISKVDIKVLKNICFLSKTIKSEEDAKRNKYFYGKHVTFIRYIIMCCINEEKIDNTILKTIEKWNKPRFPVNGHDILKIKKIKKTGIGKVLNDLEQWWIKENFKPNRIECLNRLKTIN